MDCSPPGSLVHGIFQAWILEWVAISFSRGSSRPRDWTQVSRIVGRRFTVWATREAGKEIPKKGNAKEFSNYRTIALISHASTYCSVFAWRIPGTAEPGRRPSMGSHRVGHDWSDLAAAHASRVMLKILQARLQQYVNRELPDVPTGFRKGRETRDQIANIRWIIKKAKEFQKNISFCFIDYAKVFDYVDHYYGKLLKRWEYQTTLPASWEILCRSGSNS